MYLTYGGRQDERVEQLLSDLALVSDRFFDMAVRFVSRRVDASRWDSFVSDMASNALIPHEAFDSK